MSWELVERPELVAAILRDPGKVVLVPGESGAGKSTVLAEAVSIAATERFVARPHEVMWSDPLAELLIRGLGDVVAEIVQSQSATKRVAERLASAADRLVLSQGRDLVAAVGRDLVAFVRARLGPEVGDELVAAAKALDEASAAAVGTRLDRARTETAREIIIGFVSEVVDLADGRPILFVFDRCERLDETSARLLADLAEVLPAGAQIWAAIRSDHPAWAFLSQIGASTIEIPPLTEAEVTALLDSRGLQPEHAAEVRGVTGGNALSVRAYIGLVEAGRSTEGSADAALRSDTLRRIGELPPRAARLALRMAFLSNPLPDEYMVRFTSDDLTMLEASMGTLRENGLLTPHGSSMWIHERQRQIIREYAAASEHSEAARDAATTVWEYVRSGSDPQWFVELADLVAYVSDLADEPPMPVVLAADEPQLAVIAGLIELSEPSSVAVEGSALLNYVRQIYPSAEGSELGALKRLDASGVVTVQTDQSVSVAALLLRELPLAVAVGRIGRVFGRLPIPGIASVATRAVIFPRLGTFVDAHFGIGRPTLERLSYAALNQAPSPVGGRALFAVMEARPSILVRGTFAGRGIYLAARFDTDERRDRALDALRGLDVEFLGERLVVSDEARYPMTAVPADRFLHAAERVLRRQLRPTLHGGEIRERVESSISYQELAELRLSARKILRELAGSTMRSAMELDVPVGLYWSARDDLYQEVEVHGGREITQGYGELPDEAWQVGSYHSVHLASALGLGPGESIRRITTSASVSSEARANYDPALLEIGIRRERALAFNRVQRPLGIELDESLVEMVRESFFREMADARTLAKRLPLLGRSDWVVPSTVRFVAIPREPAMTGWVPGARSTLIWAEGSSQSNRDECHVTIVDVTADGEGIDGAPHFDARESHLASLPGFGRNAIQTIGHASTMNGIAHLLSYTLDDLDFLAGVRRKLTS